MSRAAVKLENSARAAAARAADRALRRIRRRVPGATMHRAMRRHGLDWQIALQAAAIAALFVGALLWLRQPLERFWRQIILAWASVLELPVRASGSESVSLVWTAPSPMPSGAVIAGTASVLVLLTAASWRMPDALTPLKYLLRILFAVQFTALAFFLWLPWPFPYTIASHTEALLDSSFAIMVAAPALIALGHGMLRTSTSARLVHPFLILVFFALEVPHLTLVHALVLHHLSILFMPLLYLCFGALFQTMVFVALYSWVVSRLPQDVIA